MPLAILDYRARIHVGGPDAGHFLHNLVTTDIDGLAAGVWMPGALLTAQGKVQFAFLVLREEAGFVLDLDARDAADFYKRLKFYRLRAKVELSEPEFVSVSIRWEQVGEGARDGRFAEPVYRSQSEAVAENGVGWRRLRIRNGVAEPHLDYACGEVFPHDINLDQTGGVSFSKGCYVGQEVVSRMQHRGTARRRVMMATAASALAPGTTIEAGGKVAGALGSVADMTGLALVRLDRVKAALDAGLPILAGGIPLALSFPPNVTYGWPDTAGADD